MYTLVRGLGKPAVTLREASTLAVAILIAELFYKFHSFSLECLAFLATWTVLSGLIETGERRLRKRSARAQEV